MGGVRVLFAALCLAGPLWLAATMPVHACSCAAVPLEETVAHTDVIVIGTAGPLQTIGPLPPEPTAPVTPTNETVLVPAGPGERIIQVIEYLKGSGPEDVALYEGDLSLSVLNDEEPRLGHSTPTSCQVFLTEGESALVFMTARSDGRFDTHACTPSFTITNEADAQAIIEDIRAVLLGPPAEELPDTGAGPPRDGSSVRTLAFASIGAALAGAVLLSPLLLRRREP